MSNGINIWLFCFLLAVPAVGVLAEKVKPKEDCCNNNKSEIVAPEDKLINSAKIFSDIEKGGERIKVVINLKKPDRSKSVMDWRSKDAVKELGNQVKEKQNRVLKSLSKSKKEFKLRHQFEYMAAFSAEVTPDCLNKLLDDPDVVSIEPVYTFHFDLAQGIGLMNAMQYRSTYSGQGVSIAICDSGIDYTHPQLGGGGFPNAKVIGGKDIADNDDDPMPVYAHGTACAGIAAGSFDTVGDYIGGVAYGAKIYALKISQDGDNVIYSDKIAAAWEWCITHKNDDPQNPILVISNSFSRYMDDNFRAQSPCDGQSSLTAMANNVVNAGITILAASGNDGYCDAISHPACISSIISVGSVYDSDIGRYPSYPDVGCISAESCIGEPISSGLCETETYYIDYTTEANQVPSYSNTASFLDLFAPANRAYTTDIVGSGGYVSGDYYSNFGGTSAACPYAAGAVAALQSASKAIKNRFLTPAEVKDILTSTGDMITDGKAAITKPRINLGQAIDILGGNPCSTPGIGSGMSGWAFPLYTYYADSRTQVIYLASEIGRAGFITSLALDVNAVPGQVMKNWTIRMKHTTLNAYGNCALEADGWTIVYQGDELLSTTGWRTFQFTAAFEYNGMSNLMVDFSYDNASYTESGSCKSSTPGGSRSVIAYSDSLYGDPLDWTGTTSPATGCSDNVPNIKLSICGQPGPNQPVMMAEPNITDGNCNTVGWDLIEDANGYFAQCATDSYFTSVVSDSNWISELEYQFCELDSIRYYYRVKARNTLDTEGGWSNVVSSRQCGIVIPGDFEPDCDVDWDDLTTLAEQWLQPLEILSADIAPLPDGDGKVDFLDFAVFASHWFEGVE